MNFRKKLRPFFYLLVSVVALFRYIAAPLIKGAQSCAGFSKLSKKVAKRNRRVALI